MIDNVEELVHIFLRIFYCTITGLFHGKIKKFLAALQRACNRPI